jgi:hypothetical protein
MPLNESEQLFVERYALTGDIVAAVVESGLDAEQALPSHIIGQKLLRRSDINDGLIMARRVREKMEQISLGEGLTRDAQLAKLESLYREARERGKHADAIKAVETQSKLLGQMVDKKEITIGQKQVQEMSVEELRYELNAMLTSEKRKMIDITPEVVTEDE